MPLKLDNICPDWDASAPLYIQLANNLRKIIMTGDILSGDVLPSERKLTELTGASRVTIRKAIEQLINEGLLMRRRGAGTFVAHQIEQSGEELTGFSSDAQYRGEAPTSIWLIRAIANPTEEEATQLQISMTTPVVRLGRVRLADGEPLAIEHAVVPASMLPAPELIESSLYETLEKDGKRPVRGTQKLCASTASPTEAGLLSVAAGSEVLRIERYTYLKDGTPVEYTRSAYRGDKYVFVSELHDCVD